MANIEIPIQNAGIGDAIAIQNDTTGNDISHFKAFVGESVTQNGLPSGYTWYGIVYGKEKRGLMVRNNNEIQNVKFANLERISDSQRDISSIALNVTWNSTTQQRVSTNVHDNVLNTQDSAWGKFRNGLNGTYSAINLQLCQGANTSNSQEPQNLHPTNSNSYWGSASIRSMSKANFDLDLHGAKTMYGTWKNYIAQMLPMLNTGPFRFRCGKENTKELALNPGLHNGDGGTTYGDYRHLKNTSIEHIAAQRAYDVHIADEAAHHWWLPDMYELYMMMRDESFDKCYATHGRMGGTRSSKTSNRWSSVRCSAADAWYCSSYGFAYYYYFSNGFTVCPVTLLPL